jgi:hypothetical protein
MRDAIGLPLMVALVVGCLFSLVSKKTPAARVLLFVSACYWGFAWKTAAIQAHYFVIGLYPVAFLLFASVLVTATGAIAERRFAASPSRAGGSRMRWWPSSRPPSRSLGCSGSRR